MMTPTECRAKATHARETALLSPDPPLRAQWTETSLDWLRLAHKGAAQIALEDKLFGQKRA
jgi:hypothetical protein